MTNKKEKPIYVDWMIPIVENHYNTFYSKDKKNLNYEILKTHVLQEKDDKKIYSLYTAIVKNDEKLLIEILKLNPNIDGFLKQNQNLTLYTILNFEQLKFFNSVVKKSNLVISELTSYDKDGKNALGKLDLRYEFDNIEKFILLLKEGHIKPTKNGTILDFVIENSPLEEIKPLLEDNIVNINDFAKPNKFGFSPIDLAVVKMKGKIFRFVVEQDLTLPYLQKEGSLIRLIHDYWIPSKKTISEDRKGFWQEFLTHNTSPFITQELNMLVHFEEFKNIVSHNDNYKKIIEELEYVYRDITESSIEFFNAIIEQREISKDIVMTAKKFIKAKI